MIERLVYPTLDGKNFGSPQSTGITEETGKMISNPAVLKIKDGEWIMIYEQAPQRQPGEKEGPPSPANQRNLYLATSTDGARFKYFGEASLSAKSGGAINLHLAEMSGNIF